MAVPKQRTSKQRRNKRRSSVWKLNPPTLVRCRECKMLVPPHVVCGECGYYAGRAVVVKKEA